MADAVPARLKGLQLAAFAKRAAQLERFRPIVTYWCEYRSRPMASDH
jgi:vacuolar protein sorting-associated protein VTA1